MLLLLLTSVSSWHALKSLINWILFTYYLQISHLLFHTCIFIYQVIRVHQLKLNNLLNGFALSMNVMIEFAKSIFSIGHISVSSLFPLCSRSFPTPLPQVFADSVYSLGGLTAITSPCHCCCYCTQPNRTHSNRQHTLTI